MIVVIRLHLAFHFHPAKLFQAMLCASTKEGMILISNPMHLPAEIALSEDKTSSFKEYRNTEGGK